MAVPKQGTDSSGFCFSFFWYGSDFNLVGSAFLLTFDRHKEYDLHRITMATFVLCFPGLIQLCFRPAGPEQIKINLITNVTLHRHSNTTLELKIVWKFHTSILRWGNRYHRPIQLPIHFPSIFSVIVTASPAEVLHLEYFWFEWFESLWLYRWIKQVWHLNGIWI